jgi:hypothetical protein
VQGNLVFRLRERKELPPLDESARPKLLRRSAAKVILKLT